MAVGICAILVCVQVNPNAIFVNKRQEGNPVLKHIRNVRWQFADIVPDYQMGQNACAVFLSLRLAVQAACGKSHHCRLATQNLSIMSSQSWYFAL